MPTTGGVHILLDMSGCSTIGVLNNDSLSLFIERLSKMIVSEGLTVLGEFHHLFQQESFTIVFALAESHVAIHTWPEHGYVSADIFVCNYSRDNRDAADRLADHLVQLFKPEKHHRQAVVRGQGYGGLK